MALLWPTATSTDSKSSARHGYMIEGNAGTTLLDAVRAWPTPRASDSDGYDVRSEAKARPLHHGDLPSVVRGWPTPMTVNSTSEKAKFGRPTAGSSRGGPSFGLEDAVRGWSPASGHWPTPDAFVSNDAEDPETFLARKETHATRTDKEPTRAGVPLALAVKWATPRATEGEKGGPNGRDGSGSLHLAAQVLWPTTTTQDAKNNGGPSQLERNTAPLNVVATYDVLRASRGESPWGVRGRDESAAARPGLALNPVFVEALMGWPLGWTDPTTPAGPGVPFPPPPNGDWGSYLASFPGTEPALPKGTTPLRMDRLRACGNGVVPAQAAAALAELFGALGAFTEDSMLAVSVLASQAHRVAEERGVHVAQVIGWRDPTGTPPRPAWADDLMRGLSGVFSSPQRSAAEMERLYVRPQRGWRNRWRHG